MKQCDARYEVVWFAERMEENLAANDDRFGWKKADFAYLLQRLREEVNELEDVLRQPKITGDVIGEAADVANFAMMIADVWHLRSKQ